MNLPSDNTFRNTETMKIGTTFLTFLMIVSGCWAIVPSGFMPTGSHRLDAQQFFYHPPQRPFIEQPMFQNYEPVHFSQPQPFGHPHNYIYPQNFMNPQTFGPPQGFPHPQGFQQAQNYPFYFYNAPQHFPRDPYFTGFPETYDPVVQYLTRHPAQSLPDHVKKLQIFPRLGVQDLPRDCEESDKQEGETAITRQKTHGAALVTTDRDGVIHEDFEQKLIASDAVTQQTATGSASHGSKNPELSTLSTNSKSPQESKSPSGLGKSTTSGTMTTSLSSDAPRDGTTGAVTIESTSEGVEISSAESGTLQETTSGAAAMETNNSEPDVAPGESVAVLARIFDVTGTKSSSSGTRTSEKDSPKSEGGSFGSPNEESGNSDSKSTLTETVAAQGGITDAVSTEYSDLKTASVESVTTENAISEAVIIELAE